MASDSLNSAENIKQRDDMSLTPFTLRIESALHEELKLVSRHVHRSMNQLIVEAIQTQLRHVRRDLEQELGQTLEQLRAYSERDTDFTQAIDAFAATEAQHTDPTDHFITRHRISESDIS
jgi:hypothetical protein